MISINNLNFAYPKKASLFQDLSLELEPGSITGLLGTNGAGKTTLLKILAGMLCDGPGSVQVKGQNPNHRNVSFLQDIYFIPEEYALPSVAIQNYVKAYSIFYPKFDEKKLKQILLDFKLKMEDKLHQLSHGQKKKFLVAFALATNCSLLIFDEPTNGLDIPSKALFRRIVAGSIQDDQLVLISTHQVKDVENLIDKIVIIQDGTIVFNEDTISISDKLLFKTSTEANAESILYSETIPGGYKIITRQLNGTSTEIDIELLFNAVNVGTQLMTSDEDK